MAKRPPSSGTSGRSSGGITGTTVRIIHSGRLPDSMKASITLRRLPSFLGLSSVVASAISWRSWSRIFGRSMRREQLADGLGADAGGEAVLAELLDRLVVVLLGQQLLLLRAW